MLGALHSVAGDRELEECLAETALQIERLEIEIDWCNYLLGNASQTAAAPG